MSEAGRYRPEIDGLRALAVLPVVLFHSGIPGFSGGYVGVDVFFVISGFLITRIIYSELVAGNFSILHFYERRARRILPALSVVLVAATAVAAILMSATDMIQYAKALGATVFFASNFWFWKQAGGYFEPAVETHPLLHTWSLAVEEQFYIVFPLLLMACVRLFPARVKPVVALATLASFAFAVWQVQASPNAAFYLAPSRAWELGLGSLLALGIIPAMTHRTIRESLGWLAIALILVPVFLYSGATPFPGLAALPPCLGAALIIHLGDSGAGRALSWRPFVWIGLISYSLYLWHWPVIVLLKGVLAVDDLTPFWGMVAIVASVLLAWLSWRYVERPFRSRERIGRRNLFLAAGVSMAALLALAAGLWVLRGVPARFSPEARLLIEGRFDQNPRRDECMDRLPDSFCKAGAETGAPGFLFWGDSHADSLQPGVDRAAELAGATGYTASRRSCAPLIGARQDEPGCTDAAAATLEWLKTHPEITTVILIARWPMWRSGDYYAGEPGPLHPLTAIRPEQASLTRPQLFDAAIAETVGALKAMGKRVIILGDVPEIGWDVPFRLSAAHRFGTAAPAAPTEAQARARHVDADRTLSALGVTYVPLLPHFCAGTCRLTLDGAPLYVDDDHLSATGAREVIAPILAPMLR